MSDKVKGALFSMLAALGIAPARVLDLYAGTGSLGIEALSRGAVWVDFVERSRAACAVIRANLAHAGYAEAGRVHQMAVAAFLSRREPPYDLVILDPPYADPNVIPTLERVGCSDLVTPGTAVAIGHSPRVALPERPGRLVRLRERRHGDSSVSIYEVGE